MSYFYDDSISANDKTFLRRITDKRGADYTYTLNEAKKVVESPILRGVDFEQEETLNFNLLECLLLNDSALEYNKYLKILVTQIMHTSNFDFISKFYDTGRCREKLVMWVNELWPEFFLLAEEENKIPSEQIRQFSIDIFYFLNDESIKAVNFDECLSEYVSINSDYLAIEQPNIDKLISGFLLLNVSFVTISYDISNKSLFDEVYKQCLYAFTFNNITLMLTKEYKLDNNSDIAHKNYTLVQSRSDSPLSEYVQENMQVYSEIIIANCNGDITDDEDIAVSLLNSENVEEATKLRYIEVLSTVITDITQVDEARLWKTMINQRVISFTVNNITNYFLKHELNEALIQFINNEQSEIDFTTIADGFGEDTAENLYDAVAVCNNLHDYIYRKILIDLSYYFNNYDAGEISDSKFEILIVDGFLQMDTDSLGFVRDKYSEHLLMFIKQNLNKYFNLQTGDLFRLNEALQVITWDIDDDKKIALLAFNSEPVSIIEKEYSDAVNAYIISNTFDANDKQSLYMNYSQYGTQTKTAIAEMAATVASTKEIITRNIEVDDALISVLLQNDNLPREQKILLFTMAIPKLSEETCKKHFHELGLSDLSGIFKKNSGRRNYDKSTEIATILDALKLHGWIYDYDDEANSERYTIIKNPPRGSERDNTSM